MREGELVAEVDGETRDRGRAAAPRRRAHGHRRCLARRPDDHYPPRRRPPSAKPRRRAPAQSIELQEYALVGRRRRCCSIVGAILEAGHLPAEGQHLQHAAPGQRRRRARDRHDVRDRHRGHRPLGRLDGRGRRRRRRLADDLVDSDGTERSCFVARRDRVRRRRSAPSTARAIAYGKVVPFIATLAMFSIARGLALWIERQDADLAVRPRSLLRWFGTGEILTIPSSLIVFLARRGDRLGAAQPHPVRPLRGGGRRQHRGRADRRREGPAGSCSACTC